MANASPLILTAMFVFGACIGSFLNVCIFRIPLKKSIVFPGSSCPKCHTPIPGYANIPILSFLFLRGRCRSCHAPISWRYPFIELMTGLFSIGLFTRFGITPAGGVWFLFVCTLLVVAFIDLDHQIIPDRISLPGIVVFGGLTLFILHQPFFFIFYGLLTGGGILYLAGEIYFRLKKREGMGGGDVKLLAMIGTTIGVKGVLFTLFFGSFLGTLAGILMMVAAGKPDRAARIPFGPFLSAGAILYIVCGDQMIGWYLEFIGR